MLLLDWLTGHAISLVVGVIASIIGGVLLLVIRNQSRRIAHLVDLTREQRTRGVKPSAADLFEDVSAAAESLFSSVNASTSVYLDRATDKDFTIRVIVSLRAWRRLLGFSFGPAYTMWGDDLLDELGEHPDYIDGSVTNTRWHIVIRMRFHRPTTRR